MRCSRSGGITPSSPTTEETTADADITHRRHAIIETVFADLIDGPLAHMPLRTLQRQLRLDRCAPRSPTTCCARSACWPVVPTQ